MSEEEFFDTPETAPMLPDSRRNIDAAQARRLRESPQYKALKATFRERCRIANTPCHLCGDSINYELHSKGGARHPQEFELDHIKTVKEHPELILDVQNFAASHSDCNQRRGTDDAPLQLGTPSRIW